MRYRLVYTKEGTFGHQPGHVVSLRAETAADQATAETKGFSCAIWNEKIGLGGLTCCEVSDWQDLSVDDLRKIFVTGEKNVDVRQAKLVDAVNAARAEKYAADVASGARLIGE
jgi:hypothetical protein